MVAKKKHDQLIAKLHTLLNSDTLAESGSLNKARSFAYKQHTQILGFFFLILSFVVIICSLFSSALCAFDARPTTVAGMPTAYLPTCI